MIAPEADDGVVGLAEMVKMVKQAADLCIGEANRGVVAMDQPTLEVDWDGAPLRRIGVAAQLPRVLPDEKGRAFGALLHGVDLDSSRVVKIPVFLRRSEGQMGQVEADTHKPRGAGSSAFAHDLDTVAGGMVVLVDLVRHVGTFSGRFQVVLVPGQCVACAAHFPGRAAPGRSVLADPTMTIVHTSAVVDLAGGSGGVAVGHKLLREGHYVRDDAAHGCSQIPDLGRVGP